MTTTSIEWTQQVWNPIRGCTKISPGCKHCYAETFAERWRGIPGHAYEQGFDLRLVPDKLGEPLRRRKPTTYFVNSMSDLFHDDVPADFIASVWAVMCLAHWHTFQVLTKRATRARAILSDHKFYSMVLHHADILRRRSDFAAKTTTAMYLVGISNPSTHPPRNVWLGVSVEDRKYGLPRIDELRATPAAVRFLSVEPLLEDLGALDLTGIDWVIVGGESGKGARPMHPHWVRNIRDQALALRDVCRPCEGKGQWYYDINGEMGDCPRCNGRGFHGPALFFKQWGEHCTPNQMPRETFLEWSARDMASPEHPRNHPGRVGPVRVGKAKSGRELDGRTWDEMPGRRA